jgi:Rod binding domain-containing protein
MPLNDIDIAQKFAATRGQKLDERQKVKLEKTVREFEAVFVSYMLKSMKQGTSENSLWGGNNEGGDMLNSMFDWEMSKHMSNHGNFGLASRLFRQMTGEELPTAPVGVKSNKPKTIAPIQLPSITPAKSSLKTSSIAGPLERAYADRTPKLRGFEHAGAVTTNAISKSLPARVHQFDDMIETAAKEHSVDPNLVRAVIAAESGGNPNARSFADAKGLMQLIDSTAADMGVNNIWNARENINGGTKYLGKMLDQFDGNVRLALASYNAGPGAVKKYNGVPPFTETKSYVTRVMNFLNYFKQQELTNEDAN